MCVISLLFLRLSALFTDKPKRGVMNRIPVICDVIRWPNSGSDFVVSGVSFNASKMYDVSCLDINDHSPKHLVIDVFNKTDNCCLRDITFVKQLSQKQYDTLFRTKQ